MRRKSGIADAFVSQIEGLRFENAFNPYVETCEIHDRPNGAAMRRQNLRNVFHAAINYGVDSVWIGRDLGYRGGRRTGLALTDELHLESHCKLLNCEPLKRATKGPAIGERTALTVWRMLHSIKRPIFLWNVFPLHPHEPDDPLSNRSHNRAERQACRILLANILHNLRPRKVIAIGRDAHLALTELGIESLAVRHPSYGGQSEFLDGISGIYNVRPEPSNAQSELF